MLKLVCAVLLLFSLAAEAVGACSDFIDYREGNSGILLTSPHGAGSGMLLPGVPKRKGDFSRFVTKADQHTDQMTLRIEALLKEKGLSPFVVVAGINRSQIDFNRPEQEAYEVDQAGECYQYYHQQIRLAIDTIRQKWPHGLLLDVHGQSKYDYDIIRGTRNKETIQKLLERFGEDVTEEKVGFFTLLRKKGYHFSPEKNEKETFFYGGFTLNQYGSHNSNGIDALQIEVGRNIRKDDTRREKVSKDIADAIYLFYQRYYTN